GQLRVPSSLLSLSLPTAPLSRRRLPHDPPPPAASFHAANSPERSRRSPRESTVPGCVRAAARHLGRAFRRRPREGHCSPSQQGLPPAPRPRPCPPQDRRRGPAAAVPGTPPLALHGRPHLDPVQPPPGRRRTSARFRTELNYWLQS
ncbi:hypothetical protein U9M48_041962, partial [Paspalum notatum var. saurae]